MSTWRSESRSILTSTNPSQELHYHRWKHSSLPVCPRCSHTVDDIGLRPTALLLRSSPTNGAWSVARNMLPMLRLGSASETRLDRTRQMHRIFGHRHETRSILLHNCSENVWLKLLFLCFITVTSHYFIFHMFVVVISVMVYFYMRWWRNTIQSTGAITRCQPV